MIRKTLETLNGEEGHAIVLPGPIAAGAGAILLGIGAANDSGALAIIGGIVLAVGLVVATLSVHVGVDYGIYGRLEELEK